MSWDKRRTERKPGPEPTRDQGMFIVYLGLTDSAHTQGIDSDSTPELRVGDAFRLLPGAAITFGSSELCEITVAHRVVSKSHAFVTLMPQQKPQLVLVDLGSDKGTWAHGQNLPVQLLEPGTEFALAGAFRFRCQPAPRG